MKNLLIINFFLFTSSGKKLIFVFILLLILPFSGCKSVVKDTVVEEPVRIVSPNGDVYVGETCWQGQRHGQGTWTWSNGQKDVGEFRGDKHWNTTNYDKNGNILGNWVNGEWTKN